MRSIAAYVGDYVYGAVCIASVVFFVIFIASVFGAP